jgi:hypothetical protein
MQYNGTVQSPAISPYDTSLVAASGDLSGTNAGTYTITFSLKTPNSTWVDGTKNDKLVTWKILPKMVDIPTVTNTDKTYNGSAQAPTISSYPSSEITVSGTTSATNAGDYTIRFNLVSKINYVWNDSTTTEKTVSWKIAKAAGNLSLTAYSVRLYKTEPSYVRVDKIGDGEISAYSNNPSIATVTVEKNSAGNNMLKLVAVSEGTTSITVSVGEGTNYLAPPPASITITATFYTTMTVEIDALYTNGGCTYKDDAIGMTPGSDEWDEFFGHYPVMLKNGAEGKKLQRNDFTKHEDGTTADITSGSEGDVMIAFPRRGLKISIENSRYITISMTDNPNDANFEYMAHKRGSTLKDKFYLGAYKGSHPTGLVGLRSLSGKTLYAPSSLKELRTYAQANGAPDGNGGSGYDVSGWYQLIYRQCMYILKYKNRSSQSTIGLGRTNASSYGVTGVTTNTKGMDYGENEASKQMKLFGLEDFWGNAWEWIDGFYYNSNYHILTATEGFNDTGENYIDRDFYYVNGEGYIDQCYGTTHFGFLPTSVDGSETTYYCDTASQIIENSSPLFGGYYSSGAQAGAFNISFSNPTASKAYLSGRIMYL